MEKRPGEVVYREKPYVHVLTTQKRGELCDYCFESGGKLKTCSSCRILKYCHSKCQQKDWRVHKVECKCLKNLSPEVAPEIVTDSVRLLLRLLIKEKNGDNEKVFGDDLSWGRPFNALMSHTCNIKKDTKRLEQLEYLLCLLPQVVGECFELPPSDVFREIFGKMVINSCSIQDKALKDSLGTGIYLGTSRINHSCEPNAVFTFSGIEMTVRAIEHVIKTEPQLLSFSYIDTSRPSWERKKELKERYYFDCECPRCTTKCEEVDRLMTSINCPETGCNGFFGLKREKKANSLWPCERCKKVPTIEEEIDKLHKLWDESCSYKKKLDDSFKQGDMDSTLQLAEGKRNYLLENNFYKCNVNLIETTDFAMDTCLKMELYEKAAEYTEKVSEAMFQIFPAMNISVGFAFLKLGKLQLYLFRVEEATKNLEMAEKILRITHGPNDMVRQVMADLQQQCLLLLEKPGLFKLE